VEPGFQSLGRFLLEREEWNLSRNPAVGNEEPPPGGRQELQSSLIDDSRLTIDEAQLTQLFNTFILLPASQSFLLIHQQAAHERIIYDRLQKAFDGKPVATQQTLFPVTIELTPPDAVVLTEILPDLQQFGYGIEPFGKNAFVIQGTPADILPGNEKYVLEKLLEQYKHFNSELKFSKREILLRSVAWQQAIKPGTPLTEKEMQRLAADLFSCAIPNATPSGRPTYMEFKKDNLEKMFGR
jgi:DNA mismatch repair protein MutL